MNTNNKLGRALSEVLCEHLEYHRCEGLPAPSGTSRARWIEVGEAAEVELRQLMDAALIVRSLASPIGTYPQTIFTVTRMHDDVFAWTVAVRRDMYEHDFLTVATGPIVNGLPVLDDAARKALGET